MRESKLLIRPEKRLKKMEKTEWEEAAGKMERKLD